VSARRQKPERPEGPAPPEPVDVVDGVPDRSPRPRGWKVLLLAAVFAAWVAFLIYCAAAGDPK
jgi:hypothetical protein